MGPRLSAVGGFACAACLAACAFHPGEFGDQPGDGGTVPMLDGGVRPVDAGADATPVDPPDIARAHRATRVMAVDGLLDDWEGATWTTFSYDTAGYHESITGYTPSFVLAFAAVYDEQNLWFAFQVNDDNIHFDSGNDLGGDDDMVALYLDAAGDRGGVYGSDDYILVFSPKLPAGDCAQLTGTPSMPIICAATLQATSYIIEAYMPLGGNGGLTPAPVQGSTIGLDIAVADDDGINNPGSGSSNDHERDALAFWINQPTSCPGCCLGGPRPWCDTSIFGRLIFSP